MLKTHAELQKCIPVHKFRDDYRANKVHSFPVDKLCNPSQGT